MWKLFQLVVFFGVAFTGIYYQWTPNGLVLGIVAATCAFGATVLLGDLFRLLRWTFKKMLAVLAHQRAEKGLTGWRQIF
jgi:hypothetical protein